MIGWIPLFPSYNVQGAFHQRKLPLNLKGQWQGSYLHASWFIHTIPHRRLSPPARWGSLDFITPLLLFSSSSSTASSRSQCALPNFNREPSAGTAHWDLALAVEVQQCLCQRECPNKCQIDCQNIMKELNRMVEYQHIYQKLCQNRCQKECQSKCQKECQNMHTYIHTFINISDGISETMSK